MPHIHSIFPSLSLLAALLLWSSLTIAVGQSEIRYDAKVGLVSIHTSQMPLRTFLEKIAAETGIKVEVTTDEAHPITLRLDGVPLDTALKAALRGTNHILRYESVNGKPTVSTVRVVGRGDDVMAAPTVATEHGSAYAVVQQDTLEQAKEKDPEYQKSQKISRILQENMRRNNYSGPPPIVVVNRPPVPVREAQDSDIDKPLEISK